MVNYERMDKLDGFEELEVDRRHSEIKMPIMHVELSLLVRYFMNDSGVGYCSLLIASVRGKGLRGKVESTAAKTYVGRTILIFLSELNNGKKLITVPALFEKEPELDGKADLSDLDINTYYHNDFKRTLQEVYREHMDALRGNKVIIDRLHLSKSIIELPDKGIRILKSYK
jgi:hypothetical protein